MLMNFNAYVFSYSCLVLKTSIRCHEERAVHEGVQHFSELSWFVLL